MSDQWAGGKGDRIRQADRERFAAGWETAWGATPEIREAARQRWISLKNALKKIQEPVDSTESDDILHTPGDPDVPT